MKKFLSLTLALALVLSALAGCASGTAPAQVPATEAPATEAPATEVPATEAPETLPNLMVMSGPTGVGAAKLLSEPEGILASGTVVADNEAVKNALISGEADIAAVATNMAATLANKTQGGITVLAVNTMGVLYILEKGDSVNALSDLAGKTLYATGQGANPEYILNYLLTESGVAPEQVDIQWLTAQEIIAKMTTEEEAICMLPVPAATTLMMKDSAVRQAVSLSQVWEELGCGILAQGCIVARTEYLQANPGSVAAFLEAYEASLNYMTDPAVREEAAQLVADFAITANAQIAAKAIPQCNLTFIAGADMKQILVDFYTVLFDANPASIGGAMPADGFYYGAQ